MVRREPGLRYQLSRRARGVEPVGHREGQISCRVIDTALETSQDSLVCIRSGDLRAELAEQRAAPLADQPCRLLGDDAEHAADVVLVIVQGAIRERVVGLLSITVALDDE